MLFIMRIYFVKWEKTQKTNIDVDYMFFMLPRCDGRNTD